MEVLAEAKREYMAQLCSLLCPLMIETFENMYKEAVSMSKGKKILVQFQALLKDVPNWSNSMLSQHAGKLTNSCSWFSDLLAAVFVSSVKILSSVRLHTENKKISIKLPAVDVFLHKCYENAARDLYKDPYVYHEQMSENDRDAILVKRFVDVIEKTIKEMLPVQEILKAYIANPVTGETIEVPDAEEDTEDPDVGDDLPPENTENTAPVEEEPSPEAQAVSSDEIKEVPVPPGSMVAPPVSSAPPEGDDVLFPDAKE